VIVAAGSVAVLVRGGSGGDCPLSPAACANVGLAAPDPGGNEDAGLGAPPPHGKLFGFNDEQQAQAGASGVLDRLAKLAGANAIRFPVDWRLLEPRPGVWDNAAWAAYEQAYDAARANGLEPVIDFGFAPAWARDPGPAQACQDFLVCRYPPAESQAAAWGQFAAEVARHFPGAVLEVWNEPNAVSFWRPAPDAARFARLQTIAYRAIKAVDPGTKVLAGGLASPQEPGGVVVPAAAADVPAREFLNRAFTSTPGFRDSMDGVGVHPYPDGLDLGEGSLFAKELADVRRAAAAHGDPSIPLWITETGVSRSGPAALSEADQAALLRRLYERLVTMPDVAAVFIHRLLPPSGAPANSTEAGYALLRPGFPEPVPTLGYCAFVTLAGNDYSGC
jgi:hypothetical protein